MAAITKRAFIAKSALALGAIAAGSVIAAPAKSTRQLRASVKNAATGARTGLRKRLSRIPLSDTDGAFRLANRKTEIEITIS